MGFIPKMPSSNANEKSLVNLKKVIFLNPHYWERGSYTDKIIQNYNNWLPKTGFTLQTVYKDHDATVDRFTELAGYGIVHIYSHGSPYPDEINIEEVYVKTGEIANENTSKKYKDEIFNGTIQILERKSAPSTWSEIYHLSPKFIAAHNDFSKDTVLFYGGFCYSFLGGWDQLYTKFAKGAYFGFTWSVFTSWNTKWAISLTDSLCDTVRKPPYNPEKWIIGPNLPKSYYNAKAKKTVYIEFTGDATLTLWKDSAKVVTSPITNITQTTATGGGNIKSDGGFPVTARGVCWSTSSNPTTSDSYTTDGSGTGAFASNITGLTMNAPYYVRAYATNSQNTLYGNQVSFTTTSGHYIGENFGGGIIFYLSGDHGLISATIDQGDPAWGCEPVDSILIGTATAIGTGQANTAAIVNGCSEAGIAARVCDELVLNGYSDWFLPSKDELNEMYLQRNVIGDFGSGTYWSSSEYNPWIAWSQAFYDGYQFGWNGYLKHYGRWVRAIRAF
jgi:hypothetical protein